MANSDGTFKAADAYNPISDVTVYHYLKDINEDNILDLQMSTSGDAGFMIGNGNGTFQAFVSDPVSGTSLMDVDGDGILDSFDGDGAGNFTLRLGNGNGTWGTPTAFTGPTVDSWSFAADFNNDSINDIAYVTAASQTFAIHLAQTTETTSGGSTTVTGFPSVDLSSTSAASSTLDSVTAVLTTLETARGEIGASLSRLSHTAEYLGNTGAEFDVAYSRVTDADIAKDTAELVRLQILQEATTAVMAQANLNAQLVLTLLNG